MAIGMMMTGAGTVIATATTWEAITASLTMGGMIISQALIPTGTMEGTAVTNALQEIVIGNTTAADAAGAAAEVTIVGVGAGVEVLSVGVDEAGVEVAATRGSVIDLAAVTILAPPIEIQTSLRRPISRISLRLPSHIWFLPHLLLAFRT